jgi:hypothetical protein
MAGRFLGPQKYGNIPDNVLPYKHFLTCEPGAD